MKSKKKEIRICLIQHSPNSDNLGVGALTVSHISILRNICTEIGLSPSFVLVSWKDPRRPYVVGTDISIVEVSRRELLFPNGYFSTVRHSDVVVDIGAGDSFSDIYGPWRVLVGIYMKVLVLIARKPLIISPQTIGPFSRSWIRRLALVTLRMAAFVSTRDFASAEYLRKSGFKGEIVEASDVALRLPYSEPIARHPGRKVVVGINVSGLLFSPNGNRSLGLGIDYASLMGKVVSDFLLNPNVEVILVPHVISDNQEDEDDYRASLSLAKLFPEISVAPRFSSPSEAKAFISRLDFFCGARMHSCIAAFSTGVPVVPMAYSRKFSGLFESMGYFRTVDCRSESEANIRDTLKHCFEDRDIVRKEVAQAFLHGKKRLEHYEVRISNFLSKV